MARIYTKNKGEMLDELEPLLTVGNTEMLGGKSADEYALQSNVDKIIDGTTQVGDSAKLGGKSADYYDNNTDICVNLLNPTLATTTSNGVTCTNNGDGTYTLNGTATAGAHFTITNNFDFEGNAVLLGCPNGGGSTTYEIQYTNNVDYAYKDFGEGLVVSHFDSTQFPAAKFSITIRSGVTCNNLVFKPMLTTDLNATYDDFVPYTGEGKKLNECVSDLVLHPQVSNPNLLINGDFRVNQRNGYYINADCVIYNDTAFTQAYSLAKTLFNVKYVNSTYCIWDADGVTRYVKTSDCIKGYYTEGTIYTVDQWRAYKGTVTVLDKGVNFKGTTSGSTLIQILEDYTKLIGQTITLSAKIGNINSGDGRIGIYNGSSTENIKLKPNSINKVTRTLTEATTLHLVIGAYTGSSSIDMDIEWIKLEIGSIATPFTPRPYVEELALCQRYLINLNSPKQNYAVMGRVVGKNANGITLYVVFDLPVPMRSATALTLSYGGNLGATVSTYGGGQDIAVTNMALNVANNSDTHIFLNVDVASTTNVPIGASLRAYNDVSAYILISAEL